MLGQVPRNGSAPDLIDQFEEDDVDDDDSAIFDRGSGSRANQFQASLNPDIKGLDEIYHTMVAGLSQTSRGTLGSPHIRTRQLSTPFEERSNSSEAHSGRPNSSKHTIINAVADHTCRSSASSE